MHLYSSWGHYNKCNPESDGSLCHFQDIRGKQNFRIFLGFNDMSFLEGMGRIREQICEIFHKNLLLSYGILRSLMPSVVGKLTLHCLVCVCVCVASVNLMKIKANL